MQARISQTRAAQVTFALLLAASLTLLAVVGLPLWKPLFIAVVLAATFEPANRWLARKLGGRLRTAAAISTVLLVLLVLLPLTILLIVGVGQALEAVRFVRETLARGGIQGLIRALPSSIEDPLRNLMPLIPNMKEQAAATGQVAVSLVTTALNALANLAFGLAMMLIAFYALLIDGERLAAWIRRVSPLPETDELLTESRRVTGYVLRSSVLTALVQGGVATVGYLIAGVPNAIFFGLLTFFAAFIPSVGTAIVALPLTALLAVSGQVWQPIFLGAWSLIAVGLIDNLLRPLFMKGDVHLNGVLIFFALIGGMLAFGGIGILIGPLALTFFLAMVRYAYRDYVQPTIEIAAPDQPIA